MNAKPLAEMALQLWNRMADRPAHEKGAIIQNLNIWWQAEQIEAQQTRNQALNSMMNANAPPLPADEHFRA